MSWNSTSSERRQALAGLNVSGLIFNSPERSSKQYGLRVNYRLAVRAVVCSLLTQDRELRVLLIPHVIRPHDHPESDTQACTSLLMSLPEQFRNRVDVAPECEHPSHAKWLISQLDWFCGTRMHSTIAALSSGVPCASLAYSLKTQGVFDGCGLGDQVADLRSESTEVAVDRVIRSWVTRQSVQHTLLQHRIQSLRIVKEQLKQIASICRTECHA